jgi:hypothetical protein
MMMIVEQLVECELAGETEVLGENLPSATLSTINPHDLTGARIWAATVGSQQLTA